MSVDWSKVDELGVLPDDEVAVKHGVHRTAVRLARNRRGIPAAVVIRTMVCLSIEEYKELLAMYPGLPINQAVVLALRERALARRP